MFVLYPIVTLALGAVLLDEPITAVAVAGAASVMAGVWFGALSPARPGLTQSAGHGWTALGLDGQLRPGADAELGEDGLEVGLDRIAGDE